MNGTPNKLKNPVIFLLIGIGFGFAVKLMIAFAYGIDWKHADLLDIYIGIPSVIFGYTGYYTFIIVSMIIGILTTIPYTAEHICKTRWIPFSRGVTFGLGIMILYEFAMHGIPRLF